MPIDYASPVGQVRLIVNDIDEGNLAGGLVFTDDQITAFLTLEQGNVKRAAAQAIDTIADNEALASKVITDHQLQTDGAKLADALRKRAATLREQADVDLELEGYFEIVEFDPYPLPSNWVW
jgi:hypothetical protein